MVPISFRLSCLVALWLAASGVRAKNNWDTPCHDGWCQWDTSESREGAHSTIIMNGHESIISDITEAGGFRLENCDPDWSAGDHDILLHCLDDRRCHHLFKGDAVDTMVRLPTHCGKGPFARVTKCHFARDRPHFDHERIVTGQRWNVTLSYDFHKMDVGKKGKVSMFITTSNVPGTSDQLTRDWAEDALAKRGLDYDIHVRRFFGKIKDAITSAPDKIVEKAKEVGGDIKDTAQKGVEVVKDTAQDVKETAKEVAEKAANATRFSHNKDEKLKPIDVVKTINVMDKSSTCDGKERRMKFDIDAEMHAIVGFGFTIVGTAVPPNIEEFSLAATLNGNITTAYHVDMALQGTFDTGMIPLFGSGIPGLFIPGIITVGPELNLKVEITAKTDIMANFTLRNQYTLPNIRLVLPPDKGKSSGDGTKPLDVKDPPKIKANTGVGRGNATIDAHIIPRLDFGLIMLSGVVKFTTFLEIDAGAFFTIQLDPPEAVNGTLKLNTTAPATPTGTAPPTKSEPPPTGDIDPLMSGNEPSGDMDLLGGETPKLRKRETPASEPQPEPAPSPAAPPAPAPASAPSPSPSPPAQSPPPASTPSSSAPAPATTTSPLPASATPGGTTPENKPPPPPDRPISGVVNLDGAIFVRAGVEGTVLPFFRNIKAITLVDTSVHFLKKRFGPPPLIEIPFEPMKPKSAAKSLLPKLGLECFLRPLTDKLLDAQEAFENKMRDIF